MRPRGVRQTCQAEPGAPGGALAVPRRARPPLGRTCKVRPRPRSPVFRGAHGRLAPPTGHARPSGACQTCRAEAGAPGGALAVPLRARLLYPAHSGLLNPTLGGSSFVQSTVQKRHGFDSDSIPSWYQFQGPLWPGNPQAAETELFALLRPSSNPWVCCYLITNLETHGFGIDLMPQPMGLGSIP